MVGNGPETGAPTSDTGARHSGHRRSLSGMRRRSDAAVTGAAGHPDGRDPRSGKNATTECTTMPGLGGLTRLLANIYRSTR